MSKPSTRSLIILVLVAALAFVAWAAGITLTLVEVHTRMDATVPRAVWPIAIAATIVAIQLALRYRQRYDDSVDRAALFDQQARVEARLNSVLEDTGDISLRTLYTALIVDLREQRERAQSGEAAGTSDRSQYWNVYTDVLADLAGVGDTEGETPPSQ